jgi:hypothetical protein
MIIRKTVRRMFSLYLPLGIMLIILVACNNHTFSFADFSSKVQNVTNSNDLNMILKNFFPSAETTSLQQFFYNPEGITESIIYNHPNQNNAGELLMITRIDTPENSSSLFGYLFSLYSSQGLATNYIDNDFIEMSDKNMVLYMAKKGDLVFIYRFSR